MVDTATDLGSAIPAARDFLCAEVFVSQGESRYIHEEFETLIIPAYQNPIPRRSLERVEYFDLSQQHHDLAHNGLPGIIELSGMGGMEQVRKDAFTPDQIDSLLIGYPIGRHGQRRVLVNNGHANIFYVIGMDSELFAVDIRCHAECWFIGAWKLNERFPWYPGVRVFTNI